MARIAPRLSGLAFSLRSACLSPNEGDGLGSSKHRCASFFPFPVASFPEATRSPKYFKKITLLFRETEIKVIRQPHITQRNQRLDSVGVIHNFLKRPELED